MCSSGFESTAEKRRGFFGSCQGIDFSRAGHEELRRSGFSRILWGERPVLECDLTASRCLRLLDRPPRSLAKLASFLPYNLHPLERVLRPSWWRFWSAHWRSKTVPRAFDQRFASSNRLLGLYPIDGFETDKFVHFHGNPL